MLTDSAYELLRQLASPVVAVTSRLRGKPNGMILDSAIRASISPQVPRLSVYVHKWHLSHEYIWSTGLYCLHLLHRGQFGVIHQLGFSSGRERDKMAAVPHSYGGLDIPVLQECYAAFECRVVNTMDAGASTVFLADVVATHRGMGENIMTAEHFRANLPEPWREEFGKNYRDAQERIAANSTIQLNPWPGPTASPASPSPAASR
jgi:flavin reductase (DIM6/NTAB) family NADH-FMN oxidoreductase RutF